MKKLILIIVLLLITKSMYCQRYTDLQLTMFSPIKDFTYYTSEQFYLNYSVKNLGNDTINFNDTIRIQYLIDGSVVFITGQNVVNDFVVYPNMILAPNDSFEFYSPPIGNNLEGNLEFCLKLSIVSIQNTISALDTIVDNNIQCAKMHFYPLSQKDLKNNFEIKLIPNPASHFLNITNGTNLKINYIEVYNVLGILKYRYNDSPAP
jgi:hypothetical protein